MATFTGTANADLATVLGFGLLIGFTGGTVAELQDGVGDTFVGLGSLDQVTAGDGDDMITGGDGGDILQGRGGADSFIYNAAGEIAGDTIDGGAGADDIEIRFAGTADFRDAAISSTGMASINILDLSDIGQVRNHDVLFDGSQISNTGLSPQLTIIGGDGSDAVSFFYAGTIDLGGMTFTNWNQGVDLVNINGSAGNDTVVGSRVRDVIVSGDGADTVNAGEGDDVIFGGNGTDNLSGESGDDVFAFDANAQIGSDAIDGGLAATTPGDGVQISFNGLIDFRNAAITTAQATSSLEYLNLVSAGLHDVHFLAQQVGGKGLASNFRINGNTGADRVTFSDARTLDLSAFQFSNWDPTADEIRITGTTLGDNLTGTSVRDTIIGDAGDDILDGNGGGDVLFGDLGVDTLLGRDGDDTLAYYISNAEIATDTINGGAGQDDLQVAFIGLADFTAATIASVGATSVNRLSLFGAGHDVRFLSSQLGGTGLSSALLIQGDNSGTDVVTFIGDGNLDLSGFTFHIWNAAVDRVRIESGDGAATLTGTSQADVINGNGGDDFIQGGAGADTMNGGAGNDAVSWFGLAGVIVNLGDQDFNMDAAAGDRVSGFEAYLLTNSTDVFYAAADSVRLFAYGGEDFLTGGAGADYIDGGDGGGQTSGGGGSDSLVGGSGVDLLNGGGDADFLFSNGFNPEGTMKAGAGNDTLNGDAGNDGLFGGDGADGMNGGGGDDGLVGGAGGDALDGGIGADFLFGGAFSPAGARLDGSGDDTLSGGDGDDGIYGFDGSDAIRGDAGNDYVEGGAGADAINGFADSDFLLGGAGDDTINGGTGFDYLYGEAGADTFVFRKNDSADWILDFKAGDGDKLLLIDFGFANFAAVPLVDRSTPGNPAVQLTVTTGGVTDQLTIFGVTLAELNAGNVLVA